MAARGVTKPLLADATCHVNGAWVAARDAHVSAFDRGFLLGDSIFETLRTYGDHVFLPDRHVDRLFASAKLVRLDLPWTRTELVDLLRATWRRNKAHRKSWKASGGATDGVLRLTVSRGAGPFGLVPVDAAPTLAILVQPLRPPAPEAWKRGVDVHVSTRRRSPASVLDPAAKVGSVLPLVLARLEAIERGAHEALLRNMEGRVVEGTTSNFFLVRKGTLRTPPLGEGLLAGVTRDVVLEAARRGDVAAEEAPVTDAALASSDEAFLTSTTQEIVPIRRVEGKRFVRVPGPITIRVVELFRARVAQFLGRRVP
jgi:branched-chain amino acid aminotransferase